MNRLSTINEIQTELNELASQKTFAQAQRVILSVVRLLDNSVSLDDQKLFQLFTDGDGKIRANGSWFFEDQVVVDRKATYKIHSDNKLNIDFKLYGIAKPSKRTIAWVQALTPNFEDEPFNSKFNLGIDFIVPRSADRVIIVLSNQYIIRTLELNGSLTATYQEILAKWAQIIDFSNKKEVHTFLWDSFDLQPLNKKFYAGISERFILLRQHLTKESILDDKHASFFANRLMGRVIFCWFLDKKGVINPDRKYFDSQPFESDTDYYRKNLEALFYGVLNTPIPDREYKDDVTPFLNGGLFEARESDLYKDSKLTFPKNYFNDLFGFLSGYNFTTDESTSQFQQVAIDPEMLGRIFENLLAEMTEETGEQARKAKGAFYTPREIVDYMCRESLREYLKTKIPEDEFRDKRFSQLIDAPDKDFQDQDHNWRRDWKPYKDAIIQALDELKVLDPACGSGAFPIGMLQLLVRVYERLEPRFDTYKAKLQIIEKNIYGADIEPMAVEIARLRAWLSIIVDEEADSKNIKPLPNLEFKFICANSLIDLDQSGHALGDDLELAEKLQQIRDAYFDTGSLIKKKKLRSDYEKIVNQTESLFGESLRSRQLKTYRPFDNERSAIFFNPEFMFGVSSFEIVIGNPPYIRHRDLDKIFKDSLKKQYATGNTTSDIYCYFYELSYNLLTKDGIGSFITSNKWMRAGYGQKLRSFFKKNAVLLQLIDLGSGQFDSATVDTNILIFKKDKPLINQQVGYSFHLPVSFEEKLLHITQEKLDENSFTLVDKESIELKEKIEALGIPLTEWKDLKINYGILTGKNQTETSAGKEGVFIIDKDTRDLLVARDSKSEQMIHPVLRGKDVSRYEINWAKKYVISMYYGSHKIIDEFPAIKDHLYRFEDILKSRSQVIRGDHHWLELDQNPSKKYIEEFEQPKIVYPVIASQASFAYDTEGYFHNDKVFHIVGENLKFLVGFLNSKLAYWLIRHYGPTLGNAGFEFRKIFLERLPVPRISTDKQAEIVRLVDQIIALKDVDKSSNTKHAEDQIDQIVYGLYGLTSDEIESIEAK
jgi:type I restriction-modification system DNA methylase subunit